MKTLTIALSLILGVLPLAAGKPAAKPKIKSAEPVQELPYDIQALVKCHNMTRKEFIKECGILLTDEERADITRRSKNRAEAAELMVRLYTQKMNQSYAKMQTLPEGSKEKGNAAFVALALKSQLPPVELCSVWYSSLLGRNPQLD